MSAATHAAPSRDDVIDAVRRALSGYGFGADVARIADALVGAYGAARAVKIADGTDRLDRDCLTLFWGTIDAANIEVTQ